MVTLAEVQAEKARRAAEREQATMRGAALAGDGNITIEDIRRERARRASAARETAPARPRATIPQVASTVLRGFSFNANDELGGATAGLIEGGRAALEGDFANMGTRARGAFDTQASRIRDLSNTYRESHPIGATLNEMGGGALAFLGAGPFRAAATGASAAAPAITRSLPGQMVEGLRVGGATGAAYGFNESGNLGERLQQGAVGGGIGAGVGAAAPPVLAIGAMGLRSAINGARGAPRITVDPNAVGAMGGNIRVRRPPPPQGPRVPNESVDAIENLARRNRMTSADVQGAFRGAQARPGGQVTADVFGEPGRQTVRSMTQFPGQTGSRAEEVARTRFQEQPGRIVAALRRGLAVTETRQQAINRLERDYSDVSANVFRPLWQRPVPQQNRDTLEAFLAPYADDPIFQDAVRRAEDIFARDRRNGVVEGEIADNFARWSHYVKLGLDSAAKFSATPHGGGASGAQLTGIRQMRARILGAMDEAIPGYRDARQRWGGVIEAEEALDEGAGFLNMLPDEVQTRLAEMTPFQRAHARIGLANEITANMRGGRVVGRQNVANALDYRDTQEVIAAAFDNPQQAAEFLDVLNTSNELARNASTWLGGSSSIANAAYGADNAVQTAVRAGGDVARGNPGGAIGRVIGQAENALTMGMIERRNDTVGQDLLRRIDGPEAQAFANEVVRLLRQREASRAATTAIGGATSRAAGQQGGSRRD